MSFGFALSLVVFLVSVAVSLEVIWGLRQMKRLEDPLPSMPQSQPKVSIIVPALNEAQTIEPALQSLLSLTYPNLEIIVVNDRSTDATPAILERIAQRHPALRVLHISALPSGWLGKNHALFQGACVASGDYLIFTDADVIFSPDAVGRAVHYCEHHQVDHLALMFNVIAKTQLLRMLLLSFLTGFLARFKPWKVSTSKNHFIGVGAFNMVRRTAYQKTGGHAAIPLAVLDDMMLGKLIKAGGYLQHVLEARQSLSVEWYDSTPAMIKGLEKNIFAGFDYQLRQLIGATLLMLALRLWPWIGVLLLQGPARFLSLATLVTGLTLSAYLLRKSAWGYRCLFFAPLVSVLELYMWWRGSIMVLLRGGITWRGSFYSLQALRRAHQQKR